MNSESQAPAGKPPGGPRRSACAAKSREQEIERLHRMSVKERISEALGMGERFSWIKPARPGKAE